MPIGSTVVYNAGDLILSTVSSSGNTFQENKIAAATSSIILFNSNGLLSSQSLNLTTVGTASYVSGSTSIITNLTASNISASNTGSFGIVGIRTTSPVNALDVAGNISCSVITASLFSGSISGSVFGTSSWSNNSLTASSLIPTNNYSASSINANSVIINATASQDKSAVTRQYVLSRGTNLITNGYGDLFNNYNFSPFVFDPVDTYAGGGSFSHISPGSNATILTSEFISVDSNKTYLGSIYAKAGNRNGTLYTASALIFIAIDCYDIDKNQILPYHVKKVSTSQDTYLTQDLNPGDSFMVVSGSASGWYTGSALVYERQLNWWPYTSSLGYVFTPFTYTRNLSSLSTGTGVSAASASFYNTNGLWATSSISSSATGSIINFTSVWGGPLIPSGSAVRNASNGNTYKYAFASNSPLVSGSWTRFAARIEGTETGSLDANSRQFRPETKFIKLLFLPNYAVTPVPVSASIHRFAAITFNEQPDATGSAFVQNGNVFGTTALLGTGDAQALAFETNNTERMRIAATTGNVSIGTTSAVEKLNVAGNISCSVVSGSLFGTSSWATSASFVSPSGNAFVQGGNSFGANAMFGLNDNYRLDIETSGSVRMTISSTGNVGIGTTNPNAKLRVEGNCVFMQTAFVYNTQNSATPFAVFDTSSVIPIFRILQDSVSNPNAVLLIRNSANANTVVFHSSGSSYITSGNVGIGTSLPAVLLNVGSGTPTNAANGLQFGSDSSANLYRVSTGTIRTDGNLTVGGTTTIVNALSSSGININGNISASIIRGTLTGSLFGTGSWATNAQTASSLVSGNTYTVTNLSASNNVLILNELKIGTGASAGTITINPDGNTINHIGDSGLYISSDTSEIFIENTVFTNDDVLIAGKISIGGPIGNEKLKINGNISCSVITGSILNGSNFVGGVNSLSSSITSAIDLSFNLTELHLSQSISLLNHSNSQSGSFKWSIVTVGTGNAVTISWPGSYKWPNNTPPTITTGSGKRDLYNFLSYDGASTTNGIILATIAGQNM